MRVALVLTQDRGGPVDLSVAIALAASRGPHDVETVIVGPRPVTSAGDATPLLREAHVRSKTDRAGADAVRRALVDFRPDVVHAQDRRAAFVLRTTARPRRVPVVATYHGVPDAAAGRWVTGGPLAGRRLSAAGAATLAADAAVARSTRVTVAPSETMGRFLTTQLRVPAGRVRVIRNGVRLPPPHVPQPRAERFVSVGSFAALKQMPALIDAFARVAAGRPGLELWLVGDGDERARGHDLVHALGLAEQVRFLGYRDDVPAQLAACDAFVLPSINENLPLALLEAMGAGLACVATDVGGIAEALTAGAGLLVRPGDGDGLVAAMARLADEDGLARQLGARAAAVAREQFSIERCADEHVALWSELAG